jgi:hypothetical protein
LPPQHFLDPRDTVTAGVCPRPQRIPEEIQRFGRLPDINAWKPGDLLLVSALNPSRIQGAIERVQRQGGYHAEDARWQHAAVYIGDYGICEATRVGVKAAMIFPYIGDHLIRVRRDPALSSDDSWRVVVQALVRLNYSYSFSSILQLLWQARGGYRAPRNSPRVFSQRVTICSQLYADAYGNVTRKTLDNDVSLPVTPASLSCTPLLQDVQSQWLTF